MAPALTQHILAAPYTGSNNDPAEAEYIQWKSLSIIRACMYETGMDFGISDEQGLIDSIFIHKGTVEPGVVYSKYGSSDTDNEIDCNTNADIKKALNGLGFSNIRDFTSKIKEISTKKTNNFNSTEINAALDKYVTDNKLAGKGATINRLSDAAMYWYWNQVYRMSKADAEGVADGNFASCAGILSNDSNKSGTIANGTFYYVGQSGTSWETQEFKHGFYGQESSAKVQELDENISINGDNRPTCELILTGGITKTRADAYAASLNAQVAAGVVPTPNNGGATTGVGDDKVTCETAGSAAGWIICPIYNMFAEATSFFYESILQPFLYAPPVDVTPSADNPTFQAWSNFRFYGNMFLVIAMIVIVFGQSIGGGLIDAYTAKKIVPRILVAAILINVSVYIVAILVDVTNAVGNGIVSLLLSPFQAKFNPNGAQAMSTIAGGALGLILGAGSLSGFLGALATGGNPITGPTFMMVLMLVVVPLLLSLLGVFVTLVIRRGLILALVLVSPVAFALYCLPNTEKYFKKWWELLTKALLVYPIVMAIFAVANIMSLVIMGNNTSDGSGGLAASGIAGLVALFVQIIPLFMVPFAFKFAGGTMASLYAAIEGGGKRAGGMLKSRQEQSKKDYNAVALQARQRQYDRLGSIGSRNRWARPVTGFMQNRVGGRNLHLALAEMSADQFKEMDAQKATGIDDEQRGLSVNKQWALQHDRTGGTHWRIGSNGSREFRTLGGRWVAESAVDAAHTRWGGNMAAMQWSVGYEMAKAATQEEQEYLFNNYGRLNAAGSGLNLSDGQMGGMWTGAAFAQQNTDRQYKHYAWNSGNGGQLRVSGTAMMREIDERQGNWQMMSQSADTWTTMSQEIARARRIVSGQATPAEMGDMSVEDAQEVIQRGSRIAKSLGGGYRTEDGRWVDTGVGQGASGRTKEEIENFAALFDNKKQGRDDYMREVGMERRGSDTARSGDNYTAPVYDPVAGRYVDRAAVDVEASGYRTEAPQTNDPTVQRSRNNPRGG